MAALGMKVAGLLVVIHSLLLLQINTLEALNIFGYPSGYPCAGDAMGCISLPPNVCCSLRNGTVAVRFDSLTKCQTGYVYKGQKCEKLSLIASINGPAPPNMCFTYSSGINSAIYQNLNNKTCECPPSPEDKLSETSGHGLSDAKCSLPNAIMHTVPGSTDGTWVLETGSDKVSDLFSQLEKVPLDEKVSWLQGRGARFNTHESQQSETVDDSHV